MLHFNSKNSRKASSSVFVVLFALGLLVGGLGTYYINTIQITNLKGQVSDLQNQVSLAGRHAESNNRQPNHYNPPERYFSC